MNGSMTDRYHHFSARSFAFHSRRINARMQDEFDRAIHRDGQARRTVLEPVRRKGFVSFELSSFDLLNLPSSEERPCAKARRFIDRDARFA